MDKMFDSVWAMRIIALLLAFALFFYVKSGLEAGREANTSDKVDILYNIPVDVYSDNEDLLVTGIPETVNVTISGDSNQILQTKMSQDYSVFVDLKTLKKGEYHVPIQYENFSDKLNVSINPASVNVVIEDKVTKEFKVDPEMDSRLMAEDYVIKNMTADPTTVTITGARSAVESISYVKATVTDEQNIKAPFTKNANVKVLNAELNRLDLEIEPGQVKVKVEVEDYSKEIPITIKMTGELPAGVTVNELSAEPKKMKVIGKKAMIDELKELVVKFDVSDLTESGSYEAKVTVPEGAAVSSDKVKIHADINKNVSKNEE